jgi:hypothetical protein
MRDSRTDTRRDMRSLAVAGGVILAMAIICGGIVAYSYYRLYATIAETKEGATKADAGQVDRVTSPPVESTGYVGSAVCAECHGDIAETYKSHPMSHSLAEVTEATVVEDYENATFAPTGGRICEVERRGDEVLHHEKLFDADGELLYDQAVPVKYEVGSGQRGRSYLVDRGGILFQSPIGWYSHAGKWDLSPGYAPQAHQRFERRIHDGCLYCHAGRVATDEPGSDRYLTPPFVEASIGCERCHGPGEEHVKRQHDNPTSGGPDPTIVNPARLDPIHRDSVCYQCHLQGVRMIPRNGRSFYDFRPGGRLDDVWVVFVDGDRVDEEGHSKAVSQVEQMRSSRCFAGSNGQLGCISCHDPHSRPSAEQRVEYFQKRCLSCHEEQGCSLPLAERQQSPANGSCIACHMPTSPSSNVPHTALTDHRVLRRPKLAVSDSSEPAGVRDLEVFDHAEERLPPSELKRARGLALTALAGRHGRDEQLARQVEALLVPDDVRDDRDDLSAVLAAVGNDAPVLDALGVAYIMQEKFDPASMCWQQILRFDPTNEGVLQRLMFFFHDKNDLELAKAYSDQLLAINPYHSEYHGRRAHILGQAGAQGYPGAIDLAIESARQAVSLNPTNIRAQEWLVQLYEMANKPDEAEKQRQFVDRLKEALKRS